MCRASLRDGIYSAELRDRLGIERISEALHRGRLRWFGHVERMNEQKNACTVYDCGRW